MAYSKTITREAKGKRTEVRRVKPSLREHREQMARLEIQKARVNKTADTVKSIGVQMAATARNTGASVVASQALSRAEAESAARSMNQYSREDSLSKYYEAIQGAPEAEGKSQQGTTTGATPSTSGMD